MSSVKISELSAITTINANTANTLLMGVDIPSGITGKFTAHTLAQGLYSNEVLNVGGNPVTLPNTIAQFALGGQSYIQTNLVNTNDGGSADIVVTANTGTDSTYFIDVGYVNKDYQPGSEFNNIGTAVNRLDGYIYAQGSTSNTWGGNLIVGSTTTGKEIRFIAGGGSTENVVARMNSSAIIINKGLVFADGTVQNTALGSAGTYANAAFIQANTPSYTANSASLYANGAFIQANAVYTQSNTNTGINTTQNTSISSAFTQANAAFGVANTAVQNTAIIQLQSLTLTGNLIANSSGQSISVDSFTSNTATFSKNVVVLGNLTANTLLGNTFVYGSATANSNVTQLTNKSTAVTSNGISGVITMNNAALAGQAYVAFTVNNSYVQHVNDIIIVNVQNGVTSPNPYLVTVSKVAVGSFNITVYNADSGGGSSHSDAIVLNYAVMRVGN